jgi:hypothetical protein
MVRWLFLPGLAMLAALAAGCGSDGPRTYDVTGTVTLDDEAIPKGEVLFHPEDPKYGSARGEIVDGKYRAKVKEGKYRAEISATRVVPGKTGPMGEGDVVTEEYIPQRYRGDKSELTDIEVSSGKTEHNFPLKSK